MLAESRYRSTEYWTCYILLTALQWMAVASFFWAQPCGVSRLSWPSSYSTTCIVLLQLMSVCRNQHNSEFCIVIFSRKMGTVAKTFLMTVLNFREFVPFCSVCKDIAPFNMSCDYVWQRFFAKSAPLQNFVIFSIITVLLQPKSLRHWHRPITSWIARKWEQSLWI